MKKLFTYVVVCLIVFVLPHSPRVYAKEVLKITRDHFEFRDAPRAVDETFIGTLRIDTPVEWTGNVSGAWFEVKAPNGQIGWVHESGLSRPKTAVKQQKSPESAPSAPSASRSASQRPSAQVSKLQATVTELEKAKEQYEAQLKEKDRRVQELSEELEQVEEKLSDTGQMLEDQEQMRTLNERKVTEAENQLFALEGALKEKDEALLTAKVEMTKIENQLQNFRAQQGSPLSPDRILLVLSLLVNVLGFLFFLMMRKRLATPKENAPAFVKESEEPYQERLEREHAENDAFDESDAEGSSEQEPEPSEEQRENDDRMKELDVVMATPHSEDEVNDNADSADEVEIDLGDVLPAATGAAAAAGVAAAVSDSEDQSVRPEDVEPAIVPTPEVIIVEEAIEEVGEYYEEPLTEELIPDEELLVEDAGDETLAGFAGDALELPEESEDLKDLEETPGEMDEIEELIELPDESEELIELEDAEESFELPHDELEDVEELLLEDDEELVSMLSPDENDSPEPEIEAIKVSGEQFEKLPQSSTQLIESDDEDESSFDENTELPQESLPSEEQGELLHLDKAEFEENGENDEEMILGTPGIIDEDDYENGSPDFELSPEAEIGDFEAEKEHRWDEGSTEMGEDLPDPDALIEELSETEAAIAEYPEPEELIEEVDDTEEDLLVELPDEEEASDEEPYEFGETQPEVKEFEVEEIVVIDELDQGVSKALHDEREERGVKEEALDISSEVEELLDLDDAEPAIEPQNAPSFLEPSPYLIEPEHEPEEDFASDKEALEESLDEGPVQEEEKVYAIELLDAGNNTESVIHVLSKVNGLLARPGELVESAPCLIAKGAGKRDAEGFQLIMKKLGAKVRLLPQG